MQFIDKELPLNHRIVLFGDTHDGNILRHKNGHKELIDKIASEKNTFAIHMGDAIEAITVNDKRYRAEIIDSNSPVPIKQAKNVIKEIKKEKEKYGENKIGKNKKVMVEYSNANTHKEYHVGHLRNICYGDAVNKILSANGYKSIPVSYINDFGIHTAKTLWAYEEFFKDKKLPADKGGFLGQVYARAARELEKDETGKRLVAMIMKKIESRSGAEYELWKKTRKWSIAQFDKIYKELGVKFERIFYESEVVEKGMDLVGKLYEKRILTKSDGAIIADLNKYGLGVLVFLRSDGTALYPVADLALAEEKFKKYKKRKNNWN